MRSALHGIVLGALIGVVACSDDDDNGIGPDPDPDPGPSECLPLTNLGNLGGQRGRAYGINAAGQVVGFSATPRDGDRAFLWINGVMTDLGTLGGRRSQANAINDAGHVVGVSLTKGDTVQHAFLWRNGVMTDLGLAALAFGAGRIVRALLG